MQTIGCSRADNARNGVDRYGDGCLGNLVQLFELLTGEIPAFEQCGMQCEVACLETARDASAPCKTSHIAVLRRDLFSV